MEEKSEWKEFFFFFLGGGGRGGVEGNGEGQRVERVSVAVAALQMEIERRPANQDESTVHFCKFKAPKIFLCLLPKGKRTKKNALVPEG